MPIRIAVAGVNGRMGRELIKIIKESNKVILKAAMTYPGDLISGLDAGELVGIGHIGVPINDNISKLKDDFDILIDFTQPDATIEYINFCCQYNKGIVIGTTGFSKEQKIHINSAAKKIGIVLTANFSIGVNIMLKLLEKVTKVMGDNADIEIIEAHHRYKVDAPSGTALAMGESIAGILGLDLTNCAVYNRTECPGMRKAHTIGFSSIRASDIVGEHTVIFADQGERLEITHKASNRMPFANGAIRAAIWLKDKNPIGMFDMKHVLNLNTL